MGNDAFDAFELAIGGCFRISQHQLGVEDIETLVLHRAHVEVAHSNGIELLEVVLETVNLFVPCHGTLQ